jgi:GNAT superfamily N-acetyltransferase
VRPVVIAACDTPASLVPVSPAEDPRAMIVQSARFACSDCLSMETFRAIYDALDACSRGVIGPTQPRLLVIPLYHKDGSVSGGLWGCTNFQWLHVEMLFVPQTLRAQGVGSALMAAAETEARSRGCRGTYVDAFSFQAAPFYRKLGFTQFGRLDDFPPGHDRLYFCKRYDVITE